MEVPRRSISLITFFLWSTIGGFINCEDWADCMAIALAIIQRRSEIFPLLFQEVEDHLGKSSEATGNLPRHYLLGTKFVIFNLITATVSVTEWSKVIDLNVLQEILRSSGMSFQIF
jgi:hypothetical protein